MNRTLAKQYSRALIVPETLKDDTREVDVTFATETPVFRWGWDEDYNEVLSCEQSAVRTERIDKGLPVIDGHNSSSIFNQLGRTTKVWFTNERTACARIQFSKRKEVDDLLTDIRNGIVRDISVGYRVYKFKRDLPETAPTGELATYRAIDWEPHEISLVSIPADVNACMRGDDQKNEVQIIKNQNINFKIRKIMNVTCPECGHEFEAEAGSVTCPECSAEFTVDEEGAVHRAASTAGKRSVSTPATANVPATEPNVNLDVIRAEASEDERKRLNALLVSIRAAKLDNAFAIDLFNSGKSLAECRQEIIVSAAKKQSVIDGNHTATVGKDAADTKRQLAVDAIVSRSMPSKFPMKADNPYKGQSISGVLRSLMQERGVNVSGKSDVEIVNLSFNERAYSTSDLPLLMEDVMNKILRGDYEFAPEQWKTISRQKSVPDYRSQPFYQFETENGIKEIPEGGEIPYTKMIEAKQTIRIKDYGEGFKLTRQAIINDDLDVFAQIPGRFVKDHGEFCGDKVWGMIINNIPMHDSKPLFDASHSNLLTGASSAFGEEGLTNALLVFTGQKALGDKRRINIRPRYLIVPPDMEIAARKQLTSIMASTIKDVNVFQNAFELIVERRLTDPKAWYLMADPLAIDGLYYANLQGEEGLRANREEKFSTDTIDYAIRFNFGVAAIDWRGIVKMVGA